MYYHMHIYVSRIYIIYRKNRSFVSNYYILFVNVNMERKDAEGG